MRMVSYFHQTTSSLHTFKAINKLIKRAKQKSFVERPLRTRMEYEIVQFW